MKRTVADPETTYYTLTRSVATLGEPEQPSTVVFIQNKLANLAGGWRGGGVTQISKDSVLKINNTFKLKKDTPVDALEGLVERGEVGLLELLPLIAPPEKFSKGYEFKFTQKQQKAILYAILVAAKDVTTNAITYLKAAGVDGAEDRYRAVAKNLNRELDEVKKGIEKGKIDTSLV